MSSLSVDYAFSRFVVRSNGARAQLNSEMWLLTVDRDLSGFGVTRPRVGRDKGVQFQTVKEMTMSGVPKSVGSPRGLGRTWRNSYESLGVNENLIRGRERTTLV